jgi:alpha-glucosidase
MKKRLIIYGLLTWLFVGAVSAADTTYIQSPDKAVVFKLFQQNKNLAFSVYLQHQTIIEPSALRMMIDGQSVSEGVVAGEISKYSINESYPWLGAHAIAVNHCNGIKIPFKNKTGLNNVTLEVRVYNDGIAFRQIVIPGNGVHVPDESTVFNLPAKSAVWYHDLEMHYEGVHQKNRIDQLVQGTWMAPPVTFKLPAGFYASITEAHLVNYSGMALQANGSNGLVLRLAHNQPTSYPYRLRYSAEDTLRLKKPASIAGTIITPWRVVMIGKDLNTLVNSDIIHNLNPQPNSAIFPQGIHTPWIKPGRAVWKYLNGGGDGTLAVMKHFTDGAAALGFEHNILEGFWNRWTDDQLRELVDYSKQKGVGIWLWKHSKSLRDAAARDSFFHKCNALGITGVKIDFFDHEAKEVIDLYDHILKETAAWHLLVDFHGANKPTGLSRTYPNELVSEAVKGMESSKLTDRATHETTIPFTRWLAGPAEYTVLHFGERRKNTTWAHQIASVAILDAPLLTFAANPDTILANPAVEIIKNIPATWDETIVLPGSEIGELAAYARRKGDTWFVAVMNGDKPMQLKIPLRFLKGAYNAQIVSDDPASSASVKISRTAYSSADTIDLHLAAGGGFIAEFSK